MTAPSVLDDGIEHEIVAERALARDPQPVRQHHVGRAALERDLAGFGRGELERLDLQVGFAVEAMRLDDVELPRQRAGALHREPDAILGHCARLSSKRDDAGK